MPILGPLIVRNNNNTYSWYIIELGDNSQIISVSTAPVDTAENARFPTEFTQINNVIDTLSVIHDVTTASNSYYFLVPSAHNTLHYVRVNQTMNNNYRIYAVTSTYERHEREGYYQSLINPERYHIDNARCASLFDLINHNVKNMCIAQWSQYRLQKVRSIIKIEDLLTSDIELNELTPSNKAELVNL